MNSLTFVPEKRREKRPPWALAAAATAVTSLVPSVLSGSRKRKVSQQPWSKSSPPTRSCALDSAQRCTRASAPWGQYIINNGWPIGCEELVEGEGGEVGGEELSSSLWSQHRRLAGHPQSSVYTNVGARKRGRNDLLENKVAGTTNNCNTQNVSPI